MAKFCGKCGMELDKTTGRCPNCDATKIRKVSEKNVQKTKLGLSAGLLGAAIYFIGLFGGYMPIVLLSGYVLLCEESQWLRKSAVKAVVVMVLFSFSIALANLLPNVISVVDDIVSIFGGHFYVAWISNLVNAIVSVFNILEKLLLLGLGIMALNQGTFAVPVVDTLINKYMG